MQHYCTHYTIAQLSLDHRLCKQNHWREKKEQGLHCCLPVSVTVYSLPSFMYSFCISSSLNGRAPRRPKTASWLPLSSTARSRSSPFESAIASPLVLNVAISSGAGFGLKPQRSLLRSGEISCSTRSPF